jgi:rhamnosyltransferase subunit B
MAPTRKIVLATFGSLGDLHPFVALGHALKREGFEPVLATSAVYEAFIRREGLGFAPVGPCVNELLQRLGSDLGDVARSMSRDGGYFFEKIIFPHLRESYDDIRVASEGAAAVVAHGLSFCGKIAAERARLPLFIIALSPLLLPSAFDPPMGSRAPFACNPRSTLAVGYNRALLWSLLQTTALWASPIARLRREVGLSRRYGRNLLLDGPAGSLTVGMFSPTLMASQPDHPRSASIVGHSFHDRFESGVSLEPELAAFLASGGKPIVATLGSFVVHGDDNLYCATAEAAKKLGRRVVLMARDDEHWSLRSGLQSDQAFVTGYAPHSLLFPHASAIIHHGGIGTTGQALRAGAPQLIVPFLGDQADNAGRAARLGVAHVLSSKNIASEDIASELAALLDGEDYGHTARAVASKVSSEDGAAVAARMIAGALASGVRTLDRDDMQPQSPQFPGVTAAE